MKRRLSGLFLLFVPSLSIAQNPTAAPPTPTRDQVLSAAKTVIQNARFATLVTIDESGTPQARIVDPFAPDSQFTIWVGTNPLTRKVEQIARNPRVVLLWFEAPTAYVSLAGRAELVRDSVEKEKHWKPEWAGLYRNANHGDDYLLIRVIPTHMEVVGRGMAGDPKTWRPVMIDFP